MAHVVALLDVVCNSLLEKLKIGWKKDVKTV